MSRRAYVSLPAGADGAAGQWQIHYREAGTGAPVLLLHPSPLSSAFMQPLLALFAGQGRAIAWDTPGYGQSDPLPQAGPGLTAYVRALYDVTVALGLDTPLIYGSATGAQIAIEFGKAYPHATRGLLLENAAWFFDSERDAMLASYFPDISPRADGSHLLRVWQMVNQLYQYFPWYDTSAAARVRDTPAPLDIVHKTALDYLLAGPDYHRAYRAAFFNERPEQLQGLRVPTRIMRWPDSLLKKYSDRLDTAELPGNIRMHHAGAGPEVRFAGLSEALAHLLG